MHDHAGVLQQGIEIAPIGCGRDQPFEWIRHGQHEQEKSQADQPHDAENAGSHRLR